MKKKEFKKWENSTRKTLNAIWEFRNLCKKSFDRGFIGELLVLERLLRTYKSELCAPTDNKFIYTGSSNKKWDISLTLNKRTVNINAKAATEKDKSGNPKWVRQHANRFCRVENNPRTKIQSVFQKQKKDIDTDLFYAFVDVDAWIRNYQAKYFILSDRQAASILYKKYYKEWNGKRRESGSDDFWIEYEDIKRFKDNKLRKIFKKD